MEARNPGRLVFLTAHNPKEWWAQRRDQWREQPYDLLPSFRRAAEVAQALRRGEYFSTVDEDMILVVSELHRRGYPVELYAEQSGEVTRIRLDADGHLLDVLPNRVCRQDVVEALLGSPYTPVSVARLLGLDQ